MRLHSEGPVLKPTLRQSKCEDNWHMAMITSLSGLHTLHALVMVHGPESASYAANNDHNLSHKSQIQRRADQKEQDMSVLGAPLGATI